jgi:P-type conjugative transfer protein TrbL
MTKAQALKRIKFILIALAAATAVFMAGNAFAASGLEQGGGTVDEMISDFRDMSRKIADTFYDAALWVFWALAAIQFTWASAQLGLRGELSLTSFSQTLVREIMFIGFFYWLLMNYWEVGDWIVGSLRQLGTNATGFSEVTPSNVFAQGVEIAHIAITKAYDASVFKAVAAAVPVVVILVAYALAAAACTVFLIEFYILVPCGVILLGLGGSLWTKNYAENYIRSLVSVGMKLLVLQIILGVTTGYMMSFIDEIENSGFEFGKIFTLAGISIITLMLVQKIPDFASAVITGSSFGRSGDLTGAAGAVAGAAAGAAMTAGTKGIQGALAYGDAMNVPSFGGGADTGGVLASISGAAGSGGTSGGGGDSVGPALRGGSDSGGMAPYAAQGEFAGGVGSGSSPSPPGAAAGSGPAADRGGQGSPQGGADAGGVGAGSPASSPGTAQGDSAAGPGDGGPAARQGGESASDTGGLASQAGQRGQPQEGEGGSYQGTGKAERRAKQAWAVKSAIRTMLGFGPAGSYTPGGGGAFRGHELGYPPVRQNAMNPMTRAMLDTLADGQQGRQ